MSEDISNSKKGVCIANEIGWARDENGSSGFSQYNRSDHSPRVIAENRGISASFASAKIPHAGIHKPPNRTDRCVIAHSHETAQCSVQRKDGTEKLPSGVQISSALANPSDLKTSPISPKTGSGEILKGLTPSAYLADQLRTAASTGDNPVEAICDGFRAPINDSLVIADSCNASAALGIASLLDKTSQHQVHYVYDGGGQQGPTKNESGKISLSPAYCPSNIAPCYPCDATLLPEPEEQIGPPPNDETAPFVPLSAYTKGISQRSGDASYTSPSKLLPNNSSNDKYPEKRISDPDLFDSKCLDADDGTRLIHIESSSSPNIPCSKRFIHCTLQYKAKCRAYKLIAVAVCYLLAIFVILTLRNARSNLIEEKDEEALKLPPRFGDLFGERGLRKKRSADQLHNIAELKAGNGSGCGKEEHGKNIVIMSHDTFIGGGWMVHVLIGMYTFAAIAAICDIYFVPSLEHICEDLKLEADVAGATFMAAASSAPEFCTSVIGVFVTEDDVGLSAIVGSSIFNLLAIVGLCGVFAGMSVELSWYPLTRDSIFYTVAVFEMLAFMFDTKIQWYEALVMIITYSLYILVMVYNKKIEQLASATDPSPASRQSSFMNDMHRTHSARLEIIRARSHSRGSGHQIRMSSARLKHLGNLHSSNLATNVETQNPSTGMLSNIASEMLQSRSRDTQDGEKQADREGSSADPKGDHKADPRKTHVAEKAPPPPEPKSPELDNAVDEEPEEKAVAEYENPLDFPESWPGRIYWILILPVTVIHAYTIPDSRIQDSWQSKFYMVPFTLSVLYLAFYSYIMVWAMSVAAWGLNIPTTVAGMTILAAGTSVPDCLSSIFVARDGYGDMAVSNAIGSNVFDILLCLGVPWLVTSLRETGGHAINSEGMWVAGSTLVVTIIYLIISLKISNWTLTPWYGVITILVYLVIMIFCILVELNIILNLHPKQCG